MKKITKYTTVGISVAILIVSVLPLLLLARYARPIADDYGYGGPVYYALKNNGTIMDVLRAIVENIRYTYLNWQGTFTSVLFFSVQPAVFGESYYILTPFVMTAAIVVSAFLFTSIIPQLESWGKVVISCVVSLIALQFLPSVAEGIYWWNGAAHYLLCWLLFVIALSLQLRIANHTAPNKSFYLLVCLTCLVTFLVGGGNYSTALLGVIVSFVITGYTAIEKRMRKILFANIVVTLFCIIGLLISIVAPGNGVRQAGFEKLDVVSAVLTSFHEAFKAIFSYTDWKILFSLLFCSAVFHLSLRKTDFSFRYPLLVLLGSFCAFASMYTPPLYAMRICDVPRMNNMFFLAYLTFIFGNAFYVIGWLLHRHQKLSEKKLLKTVMLVGAILFILSLGTQIKSSNFYLASNDLKSNVLQTYTQELNMRKAAHSDKSSPQRFTPISAYPSCFINANHLTWSSDLLIDGVPSALPIYRSCGGEVTYIGLDDALIFFECPEALTVKDFSKSFYIDQRVCVPLREFAEKNQLEIGYDTMCDTIYITSPK